MSRVKNKSKHSDTVCNIKKPIFNVCAMLILVIRKTVNDNHSEKIHCDEKKN